MSEKTEWGKITQDFKENPGKELNIAKQWLKKSKFNRNKTVLKRFIKDYRPEVRKNYQYGVRRIDDDYQIKNQSFWVDGNWVIHSEFVNGMHINVREYICQSEKKAHSKALSLAKNYGRN